ncbi:plasmolipin-like isoform X1 [Hydra vulgaris]|uniref:plasmolipin-like isoform X1 n=1 Tax=Hydra vulgaris TaxID=6087 RepID=UPI0032EA411E
MSDAPNQSSDNSSESKIVKKPSFEFLRSPLGIQMAVNIILLFIACIITACWKESIVWSFWISSQVSYFLFTTLTPWLINCVFLIVFIFKIHTKIPINWPLTLFLNCAIWIILLVISSSIIANEARKYKAIAAFEPDALGAASAFGFFACVGLVIQALLHFREYRSPVLS